MDYPLGNEFKLIQQHFTDKQKAPSSLIKGIGDDCAVYLPTVGYEQVVSVDNSIAGKHFPSDAPPNLIASRALNVALSDLAAMGAIPRYFTLSASLPKLDATWLTQFSQGLFTAAEQAKVTLMGGDTTSVDSLDQMQLSVTVIGERPRGSGLYRSGAQAGDYIYVSGRLGSAALGLKAYFNEITLPEADKQAAIKAYLEPEPHLTIGQSLLAHATSCIDVSDGLLQDLTHILRASNVGAQIDIMALPLAHNLLTLTKEEALKLAMQGGDDYVLCFTSSLPPNHSSLANTFYIGQITSKKSLTYLNSPDGLKPDSFLGYDHFHENTL